MAVLGVHAVGHADHDLVAVRPAQPVETTVPTPTACTGVPVAAWKSMPVWDPEDHRELLAS